MILEFHPDADFEFQEYAQFYESNVPGLGLRFIGEVERASELLNLHPEIGEAIEHGFRHFVLAEFPHSIIYSVEPECL